MATLSEQLAALMEEHDLNCLTISAHRGDRLGIWCSATAHGNSLCEQSDYDSDDKTASRAVHSAISKLHDKRSQFVVPALAEL